jgi:hypothetical protein
MRVSSPRSFGEVFGDVVATVTGIAIAGTILDLEHATTNPVGWVLGGIIFAGVGMVVENAANGWVRLARTLATQFGDLAAKVGKLENSIEEIKRALNER